MTLSLPGASARLICVLALASQLSACATTNTMADNALGKVAKPSGWTPVVDFQGGKGQRGYAADLAECEQLAQANPETDSQAQAKKQGKKIGMTTAALGLGTIVVSGGLAAIPMVGAAVVGSSAVGAVAGAEHGAREAEEKRQTMVRSCLSGRGYKVVG